MHKIDSIDLFADKIRYNILSMLNNLGFGHYGGSLSIVEVLAVLYGAVMDISPENFDKIDRDHFVLSKGHGGPALYSALYLKDFFDKEILMSLNQNGTSLPSHPDRNLTPGVDMTTGSLGQGISVATGIAHGKEIQNLDHFTYTIVGDGELNEGQCWEAIQFAAHYQLDKLIVFVDDNKKQLDGPTEEICKQFVIEDKFKAFGWEATTIDGADTMKILQTIQMYQVSNSKKPKCIVLDTIKGQGIEEIETIKNNHHLRLSEDMLGEFKEIEEMMARKIGDQ